MKISNPQLKLLLLRSKNEEGFTIAITLMMGVVVLVIVTAILIKSQATQSNVVIQKETARAESIAEGGSAQYQNLLNNNRALLTYSDCTTARDSAGACSDSDPTTKKSWASLAKANKLPSPSDSQSGLTCTNAPLSKSDSASKWIDNKGINIWTNPDNGQNGKYQLVKYEYKATDPTNPNTAPGTATLTIQSAMGPFDTTDGTPKPHTPKAQVQVQFQVNSAPSIPKIEPAGYGLWAKNFGASPNVSVNVLDSSDCSSQTKFSGGATKITKQAIPFPPLPDYPTNFADLVNAHKVNEPTTNDCSQTQYPKDGDYDSNGNPYSSTSPPTTTATYKYHIKGDCTISKDSNFGSSTGNEVVVMYVDKDVKVDGDVNLGNSKIGTTKVIWLLKGNLTYGGNSKVKTGSVTSATAPNWAFFLYSDKATLALNGTDIYAFIFAPYANATLNSNFGGGLWVDTFNLTAGSISQAITQDDLNRIFTNAYKASGDVTPSMGAVTAFCKNLITSDSPSPCIP